MINNIVVVGSGVMGRGIAYVGASEDSEVSISGYESSCIEKCAKQKLIRFLKKVYHGKNDGRRGGISKRNFPMYLNLEEAASQADLMIEAVPERAEIKRAVFETIEEYAPNIAYLPRILRQ